MSTTAAEPENKGSGEIEGEVPGGSKVDPVPREMRRDARRNRVRLIAAAEVAFREEGLEVGVDEIARRAGLGVGTLYRHFPTKNDLIVAILAGIFKRIEAAGRQAVESEDDGPVLAGFLDEVLAQMSGDRALVETIGRHRPELAVEARNHLRGELILSFAPLVDRAHASGELHPDRNSEDLMVAIRMLSAAARADITDDPRRYLTLLRGGLRLSPELD